MHECLTKVYEQLEQTTDRELLLSAVQEIFAFFSDVVSQRDTLSQAQTEIALQFQQMKDELNGTKKENEILKKENLKLTDQLGLRKRDLFGRGTEKTSEILERALADEEYEDPLGDTELPEQKEDASARQIQQQLCKGRTDTERKKKRKSSGKRESDLSCLPRHTEFLLEIERLNEMYGAGNWSIRGWHEYRTLESVRATKYVKAVFVPVISAGLEHELHRVPYEEKLLKGSLVSSSLAAEIMYDKFVLGIPFYRIEADLRRDDVILSRTNMANWCIRFSTELFSLVYNHLCIRLLESGYSQSDETTLEVINDGRKAGAVSYMWVHTTSEHLNGHTIVVFCYELTRNTQHLRDFYLKQGFHGFITCDAYSAYGLLEKEADGAITVCGCMMHCRRRFVMALLVLSLNGKPVEYIENLPEYKAQNLIDEIYRADEPLKHLDPEIRLERRNSEVRPKVDAFLRIFMSCGKTGIRPIPNDFRMQLLIH